MSLPRVSILLPCFNARPFLEERINSILAQTFSDWEAIVLDSYSTDGSWEFFESIAGQDSRFRLHQVPREGPYAALNRGIKLATGEFLNIATCDDSMRPDFLDTLLEAFAICPEAGAAACDLLLINRDGNQLTKEDLVDYLPAESIKDLLTLDVVRSYPIRRNINYRPPPHDCLLHFSTKSVYFSLTQLLIRTSLARKTEPFDTTIGSIADLGWLVRLTNLAGTVHVPEKLTMWRFHGNQLSVHRDETRLVSIKTIFERVLPEIRQRHSGLLTPNDCAALLLPSKAFLAGPFKKLWVWFEGGVRVVWMLSERPGMTLRAIRRGPFPFRNLRRFLVSTIVQSLGLTPKKLSVNEES
jgi:glycosyltransferase involved in cell wall biosynthesis